MRLARASLTPVSTACSAGGSSAPYLTTGSVPISDEMEEPCDSERDRRSEYDQNPPGMGSKIGNTHDLRRVCHLASTPVRGNPK